MSGPTLQPATPILAKPMDSPKSRDMRAAPARAVAEPADAASPGAGPLEAEPLDPKPLEAEPLEAEPLEAELIEDELIEAELIEAERIEAPASPGEFPIQPAKVQRPFLRQETLERDRLLDWLHRRIHSRLVLVTAEAGYGKTTLLADFSRRTRLRTAWYRLDELDRNTISFLHYLVAAGREIDPGFAPGTAALLRELGTMAVSQDRIAETFLRELGRLGTEATVLIIDDYHLVDDVPDVRRLMRQVVASAPERLTIVLIGRRRPTLPLARLRSLGEVAELAASDLRFSLDETERLFRDTYGQPLEADVLSDLTRRTEGWAASLELVRTALHNRNAVEIRSFVRSLNGASQELYDYLAEEVVGDLELEAQQFLMRTAILQIVRPDLAAVASGLDADLVQDHIRAAERLGLLGGRGERAPRSHRYHPLVRDFLLHRLEREIGADGLAALHLTVARHADGTDWVLAAHHYAEARSGADVHRVIASSLAEIMGRGEFALAESYLNRFPPDEPGAAFEVILSRLDYSRSQTARALDRASTALEMARGTATEEAVLANVMAMAMLTGDIESARDYAEQLARGARDGNLRAIARNLLAATATSVDGNVQDSVNRLSALVVDQRAQGLDHYAAVTSINLAVALRVLGHQQAAVDAATEALGRLDALGEMRPEAYAARSARAGALAHLGSWTAAESDLRVATAAPHDLARREALIEAADIYAWYHSPTSAADSLAAAEVITAASLGLDSMWRVARAHLLVRSERLQEAQELLSDLPLDRTGPAPGQKARRLLIHAELAFLRREPGAISLALVAAHHAHQQQAGFWARCADLMAALASGDATANAALADRLETDPGTVAVMAEYVVLGLSTFNDRVLDLLALEVCRRPERWLPLLRPLAASAPRATALRAAALIERIGSWDDVRVLRKMARRLKLTGHDRDIGRRLARALSAPVYVEDFGLISVTIGDRSLRGSDIRRKVLALLCYLLTRPQLAATKDQVLEALWPDQDPEAASNSLNQTVYFLRRILDERYEDDISAPYITHSADVLRLDQGLVNSASREFASRLIGQPGAPDPETVERLSILYRGRFALDFEYEEWAAVYRDSLHASYLEAVERAIRDDISGGHYGRAIGIAQRVLAVDREAEQVELSLLRLFQLSGAHSAAAEQYANYASRLRNDLGIEPPPFADLWADR